MSQRDFITTTSRKRGRHRSSCTAVPRLAVFLVMVIASLAISPALACAVTWSVTATPSPPSITPNASSSAVSCAHPAECMAVSNYTASSGGSVALAHTWNGAAWTLNEPSKPVGAKATVFLAVGCGTEGTSCEAVGSYTNGGGEQLPLAEQWNGKAWTIQEPVTPKEGKAVSFTGISCESSPIVCEAVGSYVNGSGVEVALVEQWSGKSWQLQEAALPKPAKTTSLSGISCTKKLGTCQAVGSYINGSGVRGGHAEEWNGKAWSVLSPASPKGGQGAVLTGVGCGVKVAIGCEAVGSYTNSSGVQTALAERWENGIWQVQTPATPAEAKATSFSGISCEVKLGVCHAVGSYVNGSGTQLPLAEQLSNGKTWQLQEPITFNSSFTGISCASAQACVTVGQEPLTSFEATFAESLSDTTWKWWSLSTPTVTPKVSGTAISCALNTECLAAGNYTSAAGNSVALAHTWNGSAWTLHTLSKPTEAKATSVSGVDCSSTDLSACKAVGSYTNSSGSELPLAEAWNGKAWSVQEPVAPKEGKAIGFTAVGCQVKLSLCEAVGSYTNSGGAKVPLAEQWNGAAWTLQEPPVPKEGKAVSLSSVACTTAEGTLYCEAVGRYTNSSGTEVVLAEQLKGSEWTVQKTPKILLAEASSLKGVECVTSTNCTAVGAYTLVEKLGKIRFAEHWDGTMWSSQEIPDVEVGEQGDLLSISCATSQACTAVGSDNGTLIAERWLGEEWARQSLAAPKESEESRVVAVSCATLELCVTTGMTKEAEVEKILAELYEGPPEVIVKPSIVKFGNAMSGERIVEYTNNGPITWVVPSLTYTVTKGSKEAVTIKNACEGQNLAAGAKCGVTLQYKVPVAENYLATMKLAPAPSVNVEAEA